MDTPLSPDMISPMENLIRSYYIFALLSVCPVWYSIKRAGLNQLFTALLFLPLFGLLAVFAVLAFEHWPNVSDPKGEKK